MRFHLVIYKKRLEVLELITHVHECVETYMDDTLPFIGLYCVGVV